jgi:hypothetical protein
MSNEAIQTMPQFATLPLPEKPTTTAPDGSDVGVLLGLPAASMAHFELAPGKVARAVVQVTGPWAPSVP